MNPDLDFQILIGIIALAVFINHKGDKIMASLQEVKDAIAQEKAEVVEKVEGLNAQIEELKNQIAAGGVVTAEQLDEVLDGIKNIFVA